MTLAARLRSLRKSHHLTGAQLCKLAGIPREASLWAWEAGRVMPRLVQLCRIAAVYGITVSELLAPVHVILDPPVRRASVDSAPPA
jgi:transcriptional regulator with XRE-family HTH domain